MFSIAKSVGVPNVWANLIQRVDNSNGFECVNIEYPHATDYFVRKGLNLKTVLNRRGFPQIVRYINPIINDNNPFIFHSSSYRVCNNPNAINITTVHDFIYEKFSRGIRVVVHSWQKFNAIRKSDFVACISENTRNDLLHYLPDVNPEKVKVIYNGVSDKYRPIKNKNDDKSKDYILFVSGRSASKRFDLALEAVVRTGMKLVMVGKPLSKEEIILLDDKIGRDRYKQFSGISDEELNILYNNAYCLLYPSMYEGFGIPVIEAQNAGCPVIAYNSSSIEEIIGETPLLMKEPTIDEIMRGIHLLKNKDERKAIIDQGLLNAHRFSWNKMAKEYMELYNFAYDKRMH